jgi:hypothetical protein
VIAITLLLIRLNRLRPQGGPTSLRPDVRQAASTHSAWFSTLRRAAEQRLAARPKFTASRTRHNFPLPTERIEPGKRARKGILVLSVENNTRGCHPHPELTGRRMKRRSVFFLSLRLGSNELSRTVARQDKKASHDEEWQNGNYCSVSPTGGG